MTSVLSCSPLHVQDGETALYIASSKGHDQIVELLLRREADVNHQTKVSLFIEFIWQQIRVQTPVHNLDFCDSVLGQVCAQDN